MYSNRTLKPASDTSIEANKSMPQCESPAPTDASRRVFLGTSNCFAARSEDPLRKMTNGRIGVRKANPSARNGTEAHSLQLRPHTLFSSAAHCTLRNLCVESPRPRIVAELPAAFCDTVGSARCARSLTTRNTAPHRGYAKGAVN